MAALLVHNDHYAQKYCSENTGFAMSEGNFPPNKSNKYMGIKHEID